MKKNIRISLSAVILILLLIGLFLWWRSRDGVTHGDIVEAVHGESEEIRKRVDERADEIIRVIREESAATRAHVDVRADRLEREVGERGRETMGKLETIDRRLDRLDELGGDMKLVLKVLYPEPSAGN